MGVSHLKEHLKVSATSLREMMQIYAVLIAVTDVGLQKTVDAENWANWEFGMKKNPKETKIIGGRKDGHACGLRFLTTYFHKMHENVDEQQLSKEIRESHGESLLPKCVNFPSYLFHLSSVNRSYTINCHYSLFI